MMVRRDGVAEGGWRKKRNKDRGRGGEGEESESRERGEEKGTWGKNRRSRDELRLEGLGGGVG
jgi:hypothetical protein